MAQDLELSGPLNMAARLIEANLKRQAPVGKGTKKKPGGALKRSIKVKANYTGESVQFRYSYLYYGVYVDKGTRPYGVYGKGSKPGPWNPNPGKGEGGIKPRFWTSLENSTKIRVKRIISRVIGQYIRTQFSKQRI
jgi:hypothetical protein